MTTYTLTIQPTAPQGETCGTCRFVERVDVHQSGAPKLIYKCRICSAGKLGRARTTKKHAKACARWEPNTPNKGQR